MRFERRDLILIGACLMFLLGLTPFIGAAYAAAVAFALYFGTKVLAGRRRRQMLAEAGGGLCAECGEALPVGGAAAAGGGQKGGAAACPRCAHGDDGGDHGAGRGDGR